MLSFPSNQASRTFLFASLVFYCAKGQDTKALSSSLVRVTGDNSSSGTDKSCIMKALENKISRSHNRHLLFSDIDMAVGFTVVPQSLEVEFTLVVPTHGWVGFGISEVGSMKGADIAVIEPQDDGGFVLTDRYSKNFVEPTIDKVQNWELLNAQHETILIEDCDSESDLLIGKLKEVPITTAVVRRMLDTCDTEDEPLTSDFLQNYFIAAYGENHQKKLQFHSKRASIAEYVHVPEPLIPTDPKGKSVFDIVSLVMEVPPGVSNYCHSHVTIDQPIAVTAYSAINTKNLHHTILYKATEALTFEGDYVCGEGQMGIVQLSWSVGLEHIVFPGDLHTKLEPGEYFLESHFENFAGDKFEASPGFRIHAHEDETQFNDKGEIQAIPLDARFQTPIPAGRSHVEKGFELPSVCLQDLPSEGVTVMSSVAHMHTYGVGLQIYRTRGDRNDLVFEQRVFDFNKQNPIWKPWTILPGDRVHWKCTWDTTSRNEPVPWGPSTEEEMCMAVLIVTKGLPFRYAGSDLGFNGKTFAFCGEGRLRVNHEEQLLAQVNDPKEDVVLVEIDPTPPREAFVKKGRDRNICQALVRAEIVPPPNNWLLGSPIYFIIIAWIIQVVGRRAISDWCHRFSIRKNELWISEKSIMFMEMVVCMSVLFLVLSNYDFNFSVETNEIYDVAGEEPLGYKYRSVMTATDLLASSYIVTLIVKAALRVDFLYDGIHHGAAILAMMLLVNAADFVYAPSFLFFFGSCMLLHASATAPVFLTFLLLKLNPNPSKYSNKPLAILFMVLSVIKQFVMISVHVASIMNYRLFFRDETFRLEKSTDEWNHKPYFESRMTNRDLMMNLPWLEMLKYILPLVWIILACVQVYMTNRQLQVGIYEYKKTYDNDNDNKEAQGTTHAPVDEESNEEYIEETHEMTLADDCQDVAS